ncbi:peptide deformylase [Candidatus Vidania fulgoroideorum]
MKILKFPNDKLRIKSDSLNYKEIRNIKFKKIKNCLLKSKGLAISAPQVGINKRFFIMDINSNLLLCINPVIIFKSSIRFISKEGCLSIPNYFSYINRSKYLLLGFFDSKGNYLELFFKNYFSSCVQHEIDHLNGILILDRT